MKSLFIAGIPAMGKTFIGDFLESTYGYSHINLTNFEKSVLSDFEKDKFKKTFEKLKKQGKDIVITWGFGPLTPSHQDILKYILDNSTLVWFDGNREYARNVFAKRSGKENVKVFDGQIDQIDKSEIINKLKPIVLDTFKSDSTFRNPKEVITEVLESIDSTSNCR